MTGIEIALGTGLTFLGGLTLTQLYLHHKLHRLQHAINVDVLLVLNKIIDELEKDGRKL